MFYACDIKMASAVPRPVLNFIGKSALRQATSWVKKESETQPDETVPPEFAQSKETKEVESRSGRFGRVPKIKAFR